jgi:hypothetical protein
MLMSLALVIAHAIISQPQWELCAHHFKRVSQLKAKLESDSRYDCNFGIAIQCLHLDAIAHKLQYPYSLVGNETVALA